MKILSFGSLNIDRVYQVADFVRGGETIASTNFSMIAGGKGLNQSIALARAGSQVWHAGAVGEDGAMLREALESSGVDTSLVKTSAAPTGHAVIQVNQQGQNCIIIAGGANQDITEEDIRRAISQFGPGDILLLQNEINNIPALLQLGRQQGMYIVFNPSPVTPALLEYPMECVDLFILNEIEGALLSGEENLSLVPQALRRKYPRAAVLLTLGDQGCRYLDDKEEASFGIFPVQAVDTTAAGDTFCGYFLTAIARGLTVPEALRRASAASAMAVSRKGASISIPTWDETDHFLARQES